MLADWLPVRSDVVINPAWLTMTPLVRVRFLHRTNMTDEEAFTVASSCNRVRMNNSTVVKVNAVIVTTPRKEKKDVVPEEKKVPEEKSTDPSSARKESEDEKFHDAKVEDGDGKGSNDARRDPTSVLGGTSDLGKLSKIKTTKHMEFFRDSFYCLKMISDSF